MYRLYVIASILGLAGCITPSIPIPPPDPSEMTFEIDSANPVGTATFSYPPDDRIRDAVVLIYNRDKGEGIIVSARSDGSVGPTKAFPAVANDQVVVTFQNAEQTASTCVRIRQGFQSSTAYCN